MIKHLIDMLDGLFLDDGTSVTVYGDTTYDSFNYYPCVIDKPEKVDPEHSKYWLGMLTPRIPRVDLVRINPRKLPDRFL